MSYLKKAEKALEKGNVDLAYDKIQRGAKKGEKVCMLIDFYFPQKEEIRWAEKIDYFENNISFLTLMWILNTY